MSTVSHEVEPTGADLPKHRYNARMAAELETRWQDRWEAERTFEAPNPAGPLPLPQLGPTKGEQGQEAPSRIPRNPRPGSTPLPMT